jgi:hypothetical protein
VQLKKYALASLGLLVLCAASCGPIGPAPGFGPPFDQLAGPLLIVLLLIAGLWALKSFASTRAHEAPKHPSHGNMPRQPTFQHRATPEKTPEEILQERYARGEIDRTRYLEMLDDLTRRP